MHSSTFSEIILCQGLFPGNSTLCQSPRHPKLFWPRHLQNLVGDPVTLFYDKICLTRREIPRFLRTEKSSFRYEKQELFKENFLVSLNLSN